MNTLVFDTETTGLPKRKETFTSVGYPRPVQLAGILYDSERRPIMTASFVVNMGLVVPEQAFAVHGVDLACQKEFGLPPITSLGLFRFMLSRAELAVAHNIEYDLGIMNGLAHFLDGGNKLEWPPTLCTAEANTNILCIPPTERMIQFGHTGHKKPNLLECHQHYFGEGFEGAHDALNDTRACARVYWEMIDQGLIPEA